MPMVRGKFKVQEQRRYDYSRKSAYVLLEAVVDKDEQENALSMSTAAASVTIMITNPELIEVFEPGKHFMVDLTPLD